MDILSTREWALVILISVITSYLLLSPQFEEIQKSFRELITTLLARPIITIFTLMTAYVIACVYSLYQVGLWEWHQLKITIIWYFAVAALSLFKLNSIKQDPCSLRNLTLDNFKPIKIVEFIVGIYTFNIFIELILVPFLFLIGGLFGVTQTKKEYKPAEKFLNGILIAIGFSFVIYSIFMIFSDFWKLANEETLRDFYTPPLLTFAYSPFIFFMMIYVTYENESVRLQFFIKKRWLRIYAKTCALILFNVQVILLERWVSSLAFHKKDTVSDINRSFKQIFRMISVENNPPKTNNSEGWSPYAAKDFLANEGIRTGYYHPVDSNEWYSCSPMIELDGSIIPNNISYYVIGDKNIAKSLNLTLNINFPETANMAHDKLLSSAKLMFYKAINIKFPGEIEVAIEKGINYAVEIGIYSILVEKQNWPTHCFGGYDIKFVIFCR